MGRFLLFAAPRRPALVSGLVVLAVLAGAGSAWAQDTDLGGLIRDLSSTLGGTEPGSDTGASLSGRLIQLFALITVLSIAPGLLVVTTSFTRFVIVFSMLRSALGLNQTPPNMVLNAMALFMTFFVMQPVFDDAWQSGLRRLMQNAITEEQAMMNIAEPFRAFMFVNTRDKDIALFQDIAGEAEPDVVPDAAEGVSWRVMVPAFMLS